MKSVWVALFLLLVPIGLTAQAPAHVPEDAPARIHPLPTLRAQAAERQAWLRTRLERILPKLMEEYDVRMWILSMREYAEDPVFWSITSPTTFAARRRSIYVIMRRDDHVNLAHLLELLSVAQALSTAVGEVGTDPIW